MQLVSHISRRFDTKRSKTLLIATADDDEAGHIVAGKKKRRRERTIWRFTATPMWLAITIMCPDVTRRERTLLSRDQYQASRPTQARCRAPVSGGRGLQIPGVFFSDRAFVTHVVYSQEENVPNGLSYIRSVRASTARRRLQAGKFSNAYILIFLDTDKSGFRSPR